MYYINFKKIEVFSFVVVFFFLLLPLEIGAQHAGEELAVEVKHNPADVRSAEIEKILNQAVVMELEQSGLKGVVLQGGSEKYKPDLIINGQYLLEQDTLKLEYRLQSAAADKQIANMQINTPVTHFLDRIVADAVKELLYKGRDEVNRIALAKQKQNKQEQEEQKEETPVVIERADRATEPRDKPEPEQQQEKDQKDQERRKFEDEQRQWGVEAEVKISGAYMIGRVSEYLPYGLLIEGHFSYPVVQGEKISWRMGGSLGVLRFTSSVDYKAGYVKTLVPLGLLTELKLEKHSNLTFRFWWSAGAALRLNYEDEAINKVLAPALPYTNIGIGVGVPLSSDRLGFSAGVSGMGLFHLYEDSTGGDVRMETLLGINCDLGIVWRM